jgi:hypothetical protein
VRREAGRKVSPVNNVTPSSQCRPVCCYKRPLKEEEGLLLFAFWGLVLGFWTFCLAFCFGGLFAFEYWEEAFTLGILVWEAFRREKNY